MSIWKWQEAFDYVPPEHRVTLGEGSTPIVQSRHIGPAAGIANLQFKLESCNPSGSYKDRFAAVAVSHMLAAGQSRCIATSSGNTGSALAAYCAAAGISCEIAIVEGAPSGKLQQMMAHGADIFEVKGFGFDPVAGDAVMACLKRAGEQADAALQISAFQFSPLGMAGVRSISYELVEETAAPIDHVFVPAGGGGLTLAVAQGFKQQVESGKIGTSPRIECVQPAGNDTIASPLRDGADRGRNVDCTSKISGLQVPSAIDADQVIAACRPSGGTGHVVNDEDVWAMHRRLAEEEGIYCEPAGAVALTAAVQAAAAGKISPDAQVVCLVTGTGFKDPASVERMISDRECPSISANELDAKYAYE